MATDITELEQFRRFLDARLLGGGRDLSIAEAVTQFQEYREKAVRLNNDLQQSVDEADRGQAASLDPEALKREIRDELAREGITD